MTVRNARRAQFQVKVEPRVEHSTGWMAAAATSHGQDGGQGSGGGLEHVLDAVLGAAPDASETHPRRRGRRARQRGRRRDRRRRRGRQRTQRRQRVRELRRARRNGGTRARARVRAAGTTGLAHSVHRALRGRGICPGPGPLQGAYILSLLQDAGAWPAPRPMTARLQILIRSWKRRRR